jgi:hypothetical protein
MKSGSERNESKFPASQTADKRDTVAWPELQKGISPKSPKGDF